MARHVATKLRIEFAERQAIQLLSCWLNESAPVSPMKLAAAKLFGKKLGGAIATELADEAA